MIFKSLISIILFLLSTYTLADFDAEVIRVIDGDTIKVKDTNNNKFKIRLLGIDAPELKQIFGKESSRYLKKIINRKLVTIVSKPDNGKPYTVDFYKRILGKIYYNGKDINLLMVQEGYAWHYIKYKKSQSIDDQQSYEIAEKYARFNEFGLWANDSLVPPWKWRKINKRK